MAFRSSFIRRRTALLIACPLLLAGWWFLLFRSLQKTTVVQRPKAFANSTEDAIFELAAYDASALGAMQFDDAEDGRNETGERVQRVDDLSDNKKCAVFLDRCYRLQRVHRPRHRPLHSTGEPVSRVRHPALHALRRSSPPAEGDSGAQRSAVAEGQVLGAPAEGGQREQSGQ